MKEDAGRQKTCFALLSPTTEAHYENPKSEIRNPKQIRNQNWQGSKLLGRRTSNRTRGATMLPWGRFKFINLHPFEFVSDFGFRIWDLTLPSRQRLGYRRFGLRLWFG